MNIEIRTLTTDEIEVKIKQVTEKGAIALTYKTARVDMAMLDEVFGAENWQSDYKDIDGVLFCGIGVKFGTDWVWKWSNGVESRSDGDGNEKKGEASDAFKRAGFMWGIGRELYTAPFIFLKLETKPNNKGNGYVLSDRYAKFAVKSVGYDDKRNMTQLEIEDNDGKVIWRMGKQTGEPKQQPKQEPPAQKPKQKNPSEMTRNELMEKTFTDFNYPYDEQIKGKVIAWIEKKFNKFTLDELTDTEFNRTVTAWAKTVQEA